MKRYILYGLTMLMAFPISAVAQDDLSDDLEEITTVKKAVKNTQKKYETRTVKGRVIDSATGNPISGAIVKAAGVNGYSALTDDKGNYSVKVPVFSSAIFVSTPDYNSVSIGLVKGEEQREARLLPTKFQADYVEDNNILGTKSADDFKYSNAVNIKEEVQKQLGAYAYSTERSGTAGIGATMFIQGLNSLNANAQPLVIVDGVEVDQQYGREIIHDGLFNDILSSINPADIQDVKIIRNGTALYGSRGANGIIEITTKRSHSMATRITASISAGVQFQPKTYSVMDAEQYRGYASEMLKSTSTRLSSFQFLNSDPNYYYYNQYHNNTNWNDYIYRTAITQNYGINVEGGDDIAKYNLSVGYTSAQSNMKYNDLQRLNVRFNTDISILEKLSVKFDASFSNQTRDLRDDGAPNTYDEGTPTAPSFMAYVKSPFLSPYSFGNGQISQNFLDITDESYLSQALSSYDNYNWQIGNPVAFNEYAETEIKNSFENSLLNIAITPRYEILKNFIVSEHFSYTLVNTSDKYYVPRNGVPNYYVTSVYGYRENEVSALASKQNSVQSNTRLDWNKRYEAHNVAVFGGLRLDFENYTSSIPQGYNTGNDKTPYLSNTQMNRTSDGVDETWRNMDLYVQGNYDYKGRYYAQLNLTASGSSKFGKNGDGGLGLFGVRWGIFPSIQGSWVLTNEPWFANIKGLNYLKLTAGYDISGNDDIDVFAAKTYFASSMYLGKQYGVAGLTLEGVGNNTIKWETTRRFNTGVEGRFLNNRITAGFNYFYSRTSDLLALQELSMLTGISQNWANTGKLRNTGFDVNIGVKVVNTKDWTFSLGATAGHYSNKILDLGLSDGTTSYVTNIYNANILTAEGKAANLFYGYKTSGVFSTTEEAQAAGLYILDDNGVDKKYFGAGDVIFQDMNGDKEINEQDMVIIGNPNPDVYGNIFASLTWKRFRLDANFNYSIGNDIYNYMRSQLEGGSRFMNQTTAMTQRWQTEGQVTSIPKITFQDPMGNSRFSDRWIEDGSYMKLKSLTLSYDLPLNYGFLQGLQFWIQGNNLFTLTKYLGTDPECSVTNAVIGQGIDYGRIAQSRSIVAGVKINL